MTSDKSCDYEGIHSESRYSENLLYYTRSLTPGRSSSSSSGAGTDSILSNIVPFM